MPIIGIEDLDAILNDEIFSACGKNTCANSAKNVVKQRIRVEITLNHPHTKRWLGMSYDRKRQYYLDAYRKIYEKHSQYVVKHEREIETSVNGHVHLHGYLDFVIDPFMVTYTHMKGLVCDLVSAYLSTLPKRYDHPPKGSNVMDHWDDYFDRILVPQCCFTLRLDGDREFEWEEYIKKNAPNFEN